MKINTVSNSLPYAKISANKNQNQSFGAKMFTYRTIEPYLKRQAYLRSLTDGEKSAIEWYNGIANNINYIGKKLMPVLKKETPIVMAVPEKVALEASQSNKIYKGLDGVLQMDGRPFLAPGGYEICTQIEEARKPFLFKFSDDKTIADNAVNYFSRIPLKIAELFKPWF